MDLIKILKQLKEIKPDQDYTLRSKALILGDTTITKRKWFDLAWPSIRFGTATVMTAGLILLILAGFTSFSSVLDFNDIDPSALRAEAQAIDIQIQLTAFAYEKPLELINQTTTKSNASISNLKIKKEDKVTSPETTKLESENEESTPPLTIDQTLEELSK